jgi:hypothetical protein
MKSTLTCILLAFLILAQCPSAFGESNPRLENSKAPRVNQNIPKSIKGAVAVPGPFRVKQVIFKELSVNNKTYLAAGVVFSRNLDPATVKQNVNIRLLRKNENNFWVDASTQNNTVRINPSSIAWLCGAPLETGYYVMHLRGTIKSADGVYLDCNGDGKGEGGNLPAYESQLYHAEIHTIPEIQLVPKEQ